MLIVLPILILFFLLLLNIRILKDNYTLFNPLSIIIYVWLVVFISHHFFYEVQSYTFGAYFWVIIGIISLAIGFWITANINFTVCKDKNNRISQYNLSGIIDILKIATLLECGRLIFYIYHILYVLAGSLDVFINDNTYVRYKYLSYSPGIAWSLFEFFANALCMMSYVFLGIVLAKKEKGSLFLGIVWTIIEIAIAIITMSRLCLMMYIIVLCISFLYSTDSIKTERRLFIKILPFATIGIFMFMMFIGMQRNYMANGDLTSIVINKIFIYFAGPTEAFGKYISLYDSDYEMGQRTFAIFARVLNQLEIKSNDVVTARGTFIEIGDSVTNVYTWFRTFYMDFSYFGIVIIMFSFGLISGALYNKKTTNFFACAANAWICVAFFFSFFSYMWGKTVYIFVIALAFMFHKLFKEKIYLSEEI